MEVQKLLSETRNRTFSYTPFLSFGSEGLGGAYVNVSAEGFRFSSEQCDWPPQTDHFNVFVFGGSTTFGYGVQDSQTIPSHIQTLLNQKQKEIKVCVYNFGQGYFFSTQERFLFETLLLEGTKPDMVIFIDGLNDFFNLKGVPEFSDFFVSVMDNISSPSFFLVKAIKVSPLGQLLKRLRDTWFRSGGTSTEGSAIDRFTLDKVIERYVGNKAAIEAVSERAGVTPYFVWQPIPLYKYDLRYHLRAKGGFNAHNNSARGYPMMAEYVKNHDMGSHFVWCADMQEDVKEPLYVGKVHYTGLMNKKIAGLIVDAVEKDVLKK